SSWPRAKPLWPAPSDLSGGAPASLMGRSAIDCLSGPACGKERNQAQGADLAALLARFARKTGRRLTSDPIRTSLGLLPSGPDPVGEWLVHRQSPGPYLGPKGSESKRGFPCHTPRPVSAKASPGVLEKWVRRSFSGGDKRGIQYAAPHPYTTRPRGTGSSAFADDDGLI